MENLSNSNSAEPIKRPLIDDILTYEENVFKGLSMRQLVLSILGVAIVAGLYFLTYGGFSVDVASYLAMAAGLPFFLFAFLRPRKMPLEKYLAIWIQFNLFSIRRRVWETENKYFTLLWENQSEPCKVDIILHERDKKNKCGIGGVEIEVFRHLGKTIESVGVFCTEDDGMALIPDLTPGAYSWNEVAAPDGVKRRALQNMKFKIKKNGWPKGKLGYASIIKKAKAAKVLDTSAKPVVPTPEPAIQNNPPQVEKTKVQPPNTSNSVEITGHEMVFDDNGQPAFIDVFFRRGEKTWTERTPIKKKDEETNI